MNEKYALSHYTAENFAGIWEEVWIFLKDIDSGIKVTWLASSYG
jgi:hypothetical protein